MGVSKLSVSVPGWLDPIIRAAADREQISVSEWMTEAAKAALIRAEAAERLAYEQEHGIDRQAQMEAVEQEFQADRAARGQVAGAA